LRAYGSAACRLLLARPLGVARGLPLQALLAAYFP
jgi:hypothetical protein